MRQVCSLTEQKISQLHAVSSALTAEGKPYLAALPPESNGETVQGCVLLPAQRQVHQRCMKAPLQECGLERLGRQCSRREMP